MKSEEIKDIIVAALNNGYIQKCDDVEQFGKMIAKFEKVYYDEIEK